MTVKFITSPSQKDMEFVLTHLLGRTGGDQEGIHFTQPLTRDTDLWFAGYNKLQIQELST